MVRLITFTDQNGVQRQVFVNIVPGAGSVAQAINQLTAAGINPNSIQERGSFASVSDITSDERFRDATNLSQALTNIGSGTGSGTGDSGSAGSGDSGNSTSIIGSADDFDFNPAFSQGLADRGIGASGVVSGRARQQFDPLRSRFLVSNALNAPGQGTPQTFQEFTRTGNLFGSGASQAARDLLNQARGFGSNLGTEAEEAVRGRFLNPATTGEGTDLARIAQQAGRQRFGVLANFINPTQLATDFQRRAPGSEQTFADFLNTQIFGGQ